MATYYWVKTSGGSSTGTWNGTNTGNWSTSSGGLPGAGPPTSADDVIFDAGSDNGVIFTVTVATGAVCRNITASNLDFTMTFAGSGNLDVYGSLSFPSTNFSITFAYSVNFLSTSTGNTVDFGTSSSINPAPVFNGAGGSWLMQRAHTFSQSVTLTAGTLNLNGFDLTTKIFVSNNSNTRSIAFGTNRITLTGNATNIWSFNTATGFTYTGTPDVYSNYSGATGTRNLYHGNTAGATETNSPNFYVTAGSDSVGIASAKNIVFSGFSGAFINAATTIYGNLTFNSGMTTTAIANIMTFRATSGVQLVTTAGVTFDFPVTVNAPGATVRLVDSLTVGSTRLTTLTAGTFDLNGNTSSTGTFASTGTATRVLAFGTSGTFSVVGSGATAWNASGSNLTTTGTGSTISMTSASAKTFVGGGYNYAATLNQGGAGTLTISGNNTFQSISNTYNLVAATTITFTAASTQTVTNFGAYGSGNKALTLNSSTPGTKFNLVATRGTIDVSYCRISDSSVSGGARWQAYNTQGNVNVSGNVGWNFVRRSARTFMKLRVKSI